MKVMINGQFYDGGETPIVCWFSKANRETINNMPEEAFGIFSEFPMDDDLTEEEKEDFYEDVRENYHRPMREAVLSENTNE